MSNPGGVQGMKTNRAGIEIIKFFEGFRSRTYLCPAGVPSIGYGHAIQRNESFKEITVARAEELLAGDLRYAESVVHRSVRVPLNANQFSALASFVFNVGEGKAGYKDGFAELRSGRPSTMLTLLNAGDYYRAAQQFDAWVNVKGRPSKGLITRRAREKALFLTPVETAGGLSAGIRVSQPNQGGEKA